MPYNIGSAIDYLISRDFAPLEERIEEFAKDGSKRFPPVIAAAKANLKNPPRIYTETAIQQNPGMIGLIEMICRCLLINRRR